MKYKHIIALLVLLVGIVVVGRWLGWDRYLEVEQLRTTVQEAGLWGVVVYVAAFALGLLLQLPGTGFVAVALLAWGGFTGALVAYLGGMVAITVNFLIVRKLGGQVLTEIKNPLVRRLLGMLETYPIRTVVITRILVLFNPPINYAFAMSSLSLRDFVLGSMIGILPPLFFLGLMSEWFLRTLGVS